MTEDEFKRLIGDAFAFGYDIEKMRDLDCMPVLKRDNGIFDWGAGHGGSAALTKALEETIQDHVRAAIAIALAELRISVDAKGVTIYSQRTYDTIMLAPWDDLLADHEFIMDEEWRPGTVAAVVEAARVNDEEDKAAGGQGE